MKNTCSKQSKIYTKPSSDRRVEVLQLLKKRNCSIIIDLFFVVITHPLDMGAICGADAIYRGKCSALVGQMHISA